MKRTLALPLTVALLLITGHRLPAPISEVPETTPAPKPKREAIPRPKPKPEVASKPKSTANLSFAGAWTGSVLTIHSDNSTGGAVYLIKISDDEKTAWVNWDSNGQPSGPGHQVPCNRFHGMLTWTLTTTDFVATDTLQMNANGNATFDRTWSGDTTFKSTGTLSRQDASSAPSIPQTTTTTVAPQTAGIPTAKLVPNKPGFVFNPFDPNTKQILDVRGRASGTKVKDPSGQLFIVP